MQEHIKKHRNYAKWYLVGFLVTALAMAVPIAPVLLFLLNAGELTGYADVARTQQDQALIYGPATNGNYFSYKLELAKVRKPDVVVLGSSRMLGFRQEDFTASFVNAGRGMGHLNEGAQFLGELFKFHKPRLIVLGLDPWWFNDSEAQQARYPEHASQAQDLRLDKIKAPVQWLREGKVSIGTFAKVLLKRDRRNELTNWDNLGVSAIIDSTGFRPDGSYQYGSYYYTPGGNGISQVQLIDSGTSPFGYGAHIGRRLDDLMAIIRLVQDAGVQMVIVMPPLAPQMLDAIEAHHAQYAYLGEMRQALTNLPVEYYDLLNGTGLTNDACEYVDGDHAGEVADQRLLLAILEGNPHSVLAPLLDHGRLQSYIDAYHGKTLAPFDGSLYNRPEVDFLGLGCPK